ncbi:MAG TPA: hypothetical protein VFS67_19665 [Polyangiaceae bacterium]|nr:hypothetical protein [Polyangiaceae bacterium]
MGLSFTAAWVASCNDDSNDRVCVAGTTRLCADQGRCQGTQICLADGSGYGECDCTGPLRQPSMETSDKPITPLVGRRCSADADCGEGLQCFTDKSNAMFGGGPAGGYCSLPCTGNEVCSAVDPDSECLGLTATQSVCLRTCRNQDPRSLAENKCLTRPDVVCMSEVALGEADFTGARQPGWCFPQCGSDEDCPGRVCDLQRGVCVDARPAGLSIGEACTGGTQCAGGICVAASATEAFCSAPCVFGQPVGCGYGPSATQRDAGCLGPRFGGFLSSEGIGDSGFCAELCDVDTDCAQASNGWVCNLSDGVRERFGRGGTCFPPGATDAGVGDGGVSDAGVQDASAADGG